MWPRAGLSWKPSGAWASSGSGRGVHHLRERLPFPLREWHTDNGSEFINAVLIPWCRREGIQVTRGRGYRKNDQAWVEQKNRLVVRRLIGYDRYSSRAAYALLQRLYDVLRRQLNCFRPVRKLLRKERHGARVLKRYAPPQTPYQRLLAIGTLSDARRQAWKGNSSPSTPSPSPATSTRPSRPSGNLLSPNAPAHSSSVGNTCFEAPTCPTVTPSFEASRPGQGRSSQHRGP